MSEKKFKKIRQVYRIKGIVASAEPYSTLRGGQAIASRGRRQYQLTKKMV